MSESISRDESRFKSFLFSGTLGAIIVTGVIFAAWISMPSPITGVVYLLLLSIFLPTKESKQIGFLVSGASALIGLITFLIMSPDKIGWVDLGLNTYFWLILVSFCLVLLSSLERTSSYKLSWLLVVILSVEITLIIAHNYVSPVTRGVSDDRIASIILLSMAAGGLISLYAGLYVFLKSKGEMTGALFGGLVIAVIGVISLSPTPPVALRIANEPVRFLNFPFKMAVTLAGCMFPAMLLHLLLIIPDPRDWFERHKIIYYLIYLPSIWFTIRLVRTFYSGGELLLSNSFILVSSAYLMLGVIVQIASFIKARQDRIRRQAIFIVIVLIGSVLLMTIGGFWGRSLVGAQWGMGLLYVAFGGIVSAIGYAIVKRRAPNPGAVGRWILINSITLALMILIWAGFYYGIFELLFGFVRGQPRTALFMSRGRSGAMAFVVVLVVSFIVPVARPKIRDFVDSTLYRDKYDYSKTLTQFTRALTSIIDHDRLVELLVSQVCEAMHISRGALLLNSPREPDRLSVVSVRGVSGIRDLQFMADGSLAQRLAEIGAPISVEEIERLYKLKAIDDEDMEKLIRFDAELCVPIFSKEKLIGILLLGPKMSGTAYLQEDSVLLSALADQAAITVENIRLYAERAEQDRIRRELENARRIQMGILPDEDPETEAIEISSFFKPAAEVGGDYYDYVRFSRSQIGIAIGDVSGHGLDAGLLVTMAKSCLSTTVRQNRQIEEIMKSMNEMVFEVKARLLMTFAFSIIDAERNEFTVSSAGHPYPYHYSNATGELTTIEDGMYPLGARRDITYPSHTRRLVAGDVLIFFSDGIIEAVNSKGEQLGFDGFEALIKRAVGGHARDVRDRILDDFNAFRGDSPIIDDVTLIVVRYI